MFNEPVVLKTAVMAINDLKKEKKAPRFYKQLLFRVFQKIIKVTM